MNVYKEAKQIAKCMSKIHHLIEMLNEKTDIEGVDWSTAEFVSFTKEDEAHFRACNGETEDYFVDQTVGYFGDDYYGWLYFKTDVPGQYVKVHFSM